MPPARNNHNLSFIRPTDLYRFGVKAFTNDLKTHTWKGRTPHQHSAVAENTLAVDPQAASTNTPIVNQPRQTYCCRALTLDFEQWNDIQGRSFG